MADALLDTRIAEFSKRVGQDIKADRVRLSTNESNISNLTETVGIHTKRIENLTKAAQGKNFDFETDADAAYSKLVPSGALPYAGVKSVGGKTVVWNQLFYTTAKTVTHNKTDAEIYTDLYMHSNENKQPPIMGHKYLALCFMKTTGFSDVTINSVTNNFNATILTKDDTNITKDNILSYLKSRNQKKIYWLGTIEGNKHYEKQDYWYIRCWNTENFVGTVECNSYLFDLTLMFGSGNEPATVEEFEAMFPADYYEYNAGELLSAGVSEVQSVGKNLFKPIEVNTSNISSNSDGSYSVKGYGVNSGKYLKEFMPDAKKGMTIIPTILGDYPINSNGSTVGKQIVLIPEGSSLTHKNKKTLTDEMLNSIVYMYASAVDTSAVHTVGPFQFELGDTVTDYVPYREPVSLPIPAEVQLLEGYGWSAGDAKNWIDWENRVYHREVASVDLGTLYWNYNDTYGFHAVHSSLGMAIPETHTTVPNIVCNKYIPTYATNITSASIDKAVSSYTTVIYARDTAYTDVATFKTAMSGVMLYYELAEPELIDISDLLTADNLIETEAGGILIFKNQHGEDFRIPVPSEVEHMIDIEEAL